MAYSDKDFFLTKIKETELNNLLKDDTGEVQAEYLTAAVKAADDLINSYIAGKVNLPLKTVPEMIQQCSYYLALNFLMERIEHVDIPDWVKRNWDIALKYLDDVASGNITLNTGDDTINDGVNWWSDRNVFNREIF